MNMLSLQPCLMVPGQEVPAPFLIQDDGPQKQHVVLGRVWPPHHEPLFLVHSWQYFTKMDLPANTHRKHSVKTVPFQASKLKVVTLVVVSNGINIWVALRFLYH